jgi:hypothetical protein
MIGVSVFDVPEIRGVSGNFDCPGLQTDHHPSSTMKRLKFCEFRMKKLRAR